MSPIRFLLPLFLITTSAARAQTVAPPPAAAEEGLTVYLMTMGNGDQVWEKFGHNALWVHDPARGTDYVYNYGVFDFDSPGYWGRFVKGTWLYQLAVADVYQMMAQYQYLNRTVTAQELELTPRQELELQAFLDWNYLPENREYLYDYYRDNCSTRIRDAIDRVLGGRLRAATEAVATATTYRSHSRRLLSGDPVTYTGLELGLGPSADRPISAWEEMFLPVKVMERVREVRVADASGREVPLVRSERILYQAVGRPPEPAAPPGWLGAYLVIGIVLAAGIAGLGWGAASGGGLARTSFAVAAGVWTVLVGGGGAILAGLWAFTNHAITYGNENLFQLSPLALPLAILAPAVALRSQTRMARPALWLSLAVAASSLLGFVLQILPGLDQVNGEIIALVLPGNVALAWAVWRLSVNG